MSVIQVGNRLAEISADFMPVADQGHFKIAFRKAGRKCVTHTHLHRFQFYSDLPVVLDGRQEFKKLTAFSEIPFLKELLSSLENELLGADVVWDADGFKLVLNSVKFSRARWYYVYRDHSFFFSDDLRELLPYSQKKLSREGLFGVLKYGETPEYFTVVEDIHALPCSTFLELTAGTLEEMLAKKAIPLSAFQFYYRHKYSFEGGDLKTTERLMDGIMQQVAQEQPQIFISGGIDSTLLNSLYNRHTSSAYNAHYIYFGEEDKEIEFAKWAIQGTKADLHIWQMDSSDFVLSMELAAGHLIQPVIDNTGSVFVGSFFRHKLNGTPINAIVDGTAADSCYGSKNYNKPIIKGEQKPFWMLRAGEYVSSVLRFYNLPLHDRFIPRDSFEEDTNLLELQWYLGPFGNACFKNAKAYTQSLASKYKWYYNLLDQTGKNGEYAQYTILKLALYAAKQTTVKVYDVNPGAEVIFPFLYTSILKDQGRYSWQEKSTDNIVKYPLKKILQNYISPDFIYRSKVGLNNQNVSWFDDAQVRNFLRDVFNNSELKELVFPVFHKQVSKALEKKDLHIDIKKMVLAFTGIDLWMKKNKISLG
ncbi:asparagine synthase-related protein [Paraflavisolibacter sp. H34]|uniref:asparagine synthase-related protein n=1 Tax=Huijunlia imazamoxiresistens TaxID=3127457 RepID=UPI003017559C